MLAGVGFSFKNSFKLIKQILEAYGLCGNLFRGMEHQLEKKKLRERAAHTTHNLLPLSAAASP
jgi:hypothetical protein